MSCPRNPALSRYAGLLLVLVFAFGLIAGCESADKYAKKPASESQEQIQPPVGGELALTGTPAEMAWVKNLAETLDAARLKWDLRDSVGAIVSADSLARVAEAALDTLDIASPMSNFVAIYISDVYGSLEKWESARGNRAAVAELSKRYNALAVRLQARRDSVTAQEQ